jgi:O-succinylbenzoic acid--CoA ligase
MKGADLLRAGPPSDWQGDETFLLLNPRMSPDWRQCIMASEFPDLPTCVWLATSGTAGALKLVALSRRALEASATSVNSHLHSGPDDVWLNPLPLFHVGGLGIALRASLSGARQEFCGKWSAETFLRRTDETGATLASLVPAQVYDLAQTERSAPSTMRAIVVGGGFLPESVRALMARRGWKLLPSYGLTEASSQVATAAIGQKDFTWFPLLPHLEARLGEGMVLELRGPSMLEGWLVFDAKGTVLWEDPKQCGWFRTGDRVELQGRRVRVLGRVDDLVKIRGEVVDLAALERALQDHVSGGKVMLQSLPDVRNGVSLRVVAENARAVSEAKAICHAIFPPYARPQEVTEGPISTTALGKTVRPKQSA